MGSVDDYLKSIGATKPAISPVGTTEVRNVPTNFSVSTPVMEPTPDMGRFDALKMLDGTPQNSQKAGNSCGSSDERLYVILQAINTNLGLIADAILCASRMQEQNFTIEPLDSIPTAELNDMLEGGSPASTKKKTVKKEKIEKPKFPADIVDDVKKVTEKLKGMADAVGANKISIDAVLSKTLVKDRDYLRDTLVYNGTQLEGDFIVW